MPKRTSRDPESDQPSDMENASKRRLRNLEDYADSSMFSDMTIRYGRSGEKTFQAHKMILSLKSHWFQAAFTGQFKESYATEIILHDDDAASVKMMLDYAYGMPIPTEWSPRDDARLYVDLYRVADKYDYPELQKEAANGFYNEMASFVELHDYDDSSTEFCKIIEKLYDLPGANASHPMVRRFLEITTECHWFRILGEAGSSSRLLVDASKQVPELGRDLFLQLMENSHNIAGDARRDLDVTSVVKCPQCDDEHRMLTSQIEEKVGWCFECGLLIEDWSSYVKIIEEDEDKDEGEN